MKTKFIFRPVPVSVGAFETVGRCLMCCTELRLVRGHNYATFTAGSEVLGVCCDGCFVPNTTRGTGTVRR